MREKRIERKEVTRTLMVPFGEEKREQLINEMVAALRTEEDLKQERRDLNREIKGWVEVRNNNSKKLEEGGEEKPVKCEEVWDFDAGTVTTIRLDTMEQVSGPRNIEPKDRQGELLPGGEGEEKEPGPSPDEMVQCPSCGGWQPDMGNHVACEECGEGPMPTAQAGEPEQEPEDEGEEAA